MGKHFSCHSYFLPVYHYLYPTSHCFSCSWWPLHLPLHFRLRSVVLQTVSLFTQILLPHRCQKDPTAQLMLAESDLPTPNRRTKGPRYVPVARRGDKPDGIAWLVKHHPELKDSQIVKLIGTTKETIVKIRERTHWNIANITAKHVTKIKRD